MNRPSSTREPESFAAFAMSVCLTPASASTFPSTSKANASGGAALKPYRVEYWGEWNELVPCGYVGLLGLMLVLAAWFGRSRSDELPACRVSIDNDPGEKGGPSSADSNKLAARRGSTLMIWFWSGVALVALA